MTGFREAILGPTYFYHRHLIEQSKNWPAHQIKAYQEKRLERFVRRYGSQITHKDDYRSNPCHYGRWHMPPLTHTVRTGGTTGQPLRFTADTFARRQKERAYLFDIWSLVGYAPYDLRVVYRGNCYRSLLHYDVPENAWFISPSETTERQLDRLRDWIKRVPPFFLHVYPGSLYSLIDLLGEDLFRRLPVRGVLAGSEAFPVGEQIRFEQDFGIRVAHWYGHSEYAALAYLCRECRGFHFYPTYGLVELVDSDALELSHIIATSFNRLGTQFVRYDTGDLAAPPTGPCAGTFLRVGTIVGRSQETFIDATGRHRALGSYVFGIHGAFWDHVRDLQFVQDRPGGLRVRVVQSTNPNRSQIERTLKRRMPMVALEFEYVASIERSTNGKRRYLVGGAPTN